MHAKPLTNNSTHAPKSSLPASLQSRARILQVVRWLGIVVALLLIGDVVSQHINPAQPTWFFDMRAYYDGVLAICLLCPFTKLAQMGSKLWWSAFALLCVLAVGFAFLRVIGVLFDSMAAYEAGEKLGVPGWSGMLIFAVFSQLPTILFQRYPHQLG